MWVKVENKIHSGSGPLYNPILLTKSTTLDDFYESYAIYYMLETKRLLAVSILDSTKEVALFYMKPFKHDNWYHLVICYNDDTFKLYVNGILEDQHEKKFKTHFLASDSVLIGNTGNKKNCRFLNATVDDIEFYDRLLTDEEVQSLYNAPNPNKNKTIILWILACFTIITITILLYIFIKYRIKTAVKKEKNRLELQNKLLETELRVNRASMNPHFLFNSLNALHNLILNNEIDNASDYLIKFSRLLRKILDSNMNETISLELEIELLELYLDIENLRFEENISYTITCEETLPRATSHIPIMMLQPFVENAIWHGLLNKQGEKKINIYFSKYEEKHIYCIIEDNGTGRKKANPDVFEKKSMATSFILQRLELLNKIHSFKSSLIIEDKHDNTGTIVKIILPILNN